METDSSNDLVQIVVGLFLASTQVDPDLVRDFFIVFSRFEYAMKRAGFLKPKQTKAEADWDRLGVCLRASFESRHTPEFESAVQYLTEHPPQKQVVIDGNLSWSPTSCGDGESRSQFVLRLVRIVRNNLFHGGKFPVPLELNARS